MEDKKRNRVVSQALLNTNTTEGYFKYFYSLKQLYGVKLSDNDLYNQIEVGREYYGLGRKYSSYESFKVMKGKFHKKDETKTEDETPEEVKPIIEQKEEIVEKVVEKKRLAPKKTVKRRRRRSAAKRK